jgi:hypothetical protein
MEENFTTESDRRLFLKRAGVVAGATVWATPVIQSVASPAFAAGSPAQECPPEKLIRFKYDVGTGFDSGLPSQTSESGECLVQVDDYYSTGTRAVGANGCFSDAGGCSVCVSVVLSADNKTATVTVTGGTINDVDIKGGSSNSPKGHCTDGDPSGDGSSAVIQAPAGSAAISFVGGVICPKC